MPNRGPQFQLPKKRKLSLVERLDKINVLGLISLGFGAYLFIILIFSISEFFLVDSSKYLVHSTGCFGDVLYFNLSSILTIGYGDIVPIGSFRFLSIVETFIGIGIFSLFISLLTIKIIIPKKNTIVFSKYAYFCTDNNMFLVIYLNTANQNLINVETSRYFKLAGNWHVTSASRAPFITKSVQTFYLNTNHTIDEIKNRLKPGDCLRVSISGILGMTTYSTFVEYASENILVIPNRKALRAYDGFNHVDQLITTEEFQKMFHYCPPNVKNLNEHCNGQ